MSDNTYMTILSFDLGIKNMGACALSDKCEIIEWTLLTLDSKKISDVALCLDSWISATLLDRDETNVIVVLECQPWRNHQTTRLFTVMETYFTVAYPSFVIRKVSSNCKWKYLKRPVPSSYHERKRQIVEHCKLLLKDSALLDWFESQIKKDDLADAYVQALYVYVIDAKGTFS